MKYNNSGNNDSGNNNNNNVYHLIKLVAVAATITVAGKNSVHPEETPVHADARPGGCLALGNCLYLPP